MLFRKQVGVIKNFIIDIAIFLFVIIAFIFGFFLVDLYITMTLFLLVAIWLFDVIMKRLLNYDNATQFADLSFSAIAFTVGKGVSLIDLTYKKVTIETEYTIRFILLLFFLLVIWMINLRVCGYITQTTSNDSQYEEENFVSLMAWSVSFLMALSSVVVVMILQSLEL